VRPEGLGKSKKFIHLIGSQTSGLPACSIVPLPLRYCVPPLPRRVWKQNISTSRNSSSGVLGNKRLASGEREKTTPWPESTSELYRLSDRRLLAKLVPTLQIESASYSYSPLSRLKPILFLPSSSSVVLTRLSGIRSRPTTSQKIW
jgi:hypothetical protein